MIYRHACSKCLLVTWVRCGTCDRGYCGNCSRKANGGKTVCAHCGSDKLKY